MKKKLIILGGGLSGLAAAEKLSLKYDITIIEAAPFLGGLASNFEKDGKFIPRYYHHIIKSNKTTQEYVKNFGEVDSKKLKWQKIKIAIGFKSKLFNISEILGLLKFNYLNLFEKFRFGTFGLYTLFLMNPDNIDENLDAEKWLNKYAGKNVTKKIFHNLYSRNKFNIPLSRISAKQFANRLFEKEIYDYFTFPEGGYQKMIDNLQSKIELSGGKIMLSTKPDSIDLIEKIMKIDGKEIKYDLLINSIPFQEFVPITKGLPEEFKNQILKIKYCPAVSICFATEQFLDKKNYWINLFDERAHIVMQHSILNDTYSEKISWCLRYGGSEEDLELSEEQIKQDYTEVVKKYFPQCKINWVKVMRTKYGEPIYDIDYHKYMPGYKTPIEGLYFTGIQLTHPKIRNMNVALESGVKVAEIVLNDNQ
ncbi:NAD(P)-binding protein [archaeon]|jgi:protoporphyrinogen oxidase|nr:NAD(P)-binding protein [archaeon]MBT3451154.1 NAD(P)-binding protein [archaeon]MBT6869305.1 NAD(P)-binding protein [archaeon]MBT7192468.1 NAD(P)-binding protein [archaeon]MBT7380544.1 NAD(P)-binding protein [archaeon]